MIVEFLQSLFLKAPKWARKQKLVQESIAIGARYKRNKKYWDPHLKKSQEEILKFIEAHPSSKRLIVFGSGALLDFPKSLLESAQLEIYLFDAVHPRFLQKSSAGANCHLITTDLNQKFETLLDDFAHIFETADVFISTNLLSQLSIMGSRHLKGEVREIFARGLVENHFLFLKALKRPVLLISDFEKVFKDSEEKTILSEGSLWNYKLPEPQNIWKWPVAPRGELSNEYALELRVGSWTF